MLSWKPSAPEDNDGEEHDFTNYTSITIINMFTTKMVFGLYSCRALFFHKWVSIEPLIYTMLQLAKHEANIYFALSSECINTFSQLYLVFSQPLPPEETNLNSY